MRSKRVSTPNASSSVQAASCSSVRIRARFAVRTAAGGGHRNHRDRRPRQVRVAVLRQHDRAGDRARRKPARRDRQAAELPGPRAHLGHLHEHLAVEDASWRTAYSATASTIRTSCLSSSRASMRSADPADQRCGGQNRCGYRSQRDQDRRQRRTQGVVAVDRHLLHHANADRARIRRGRRPRSASTTHCVSSKR